LVGPSSGYGAGGRLFAELLARGRELREIGIAALAGEAASGETELEAEIAGAVDELTPADPEAVRPALIGTSLGAVAAARFAARRPGAVSSLTLVAGWVRPTEKMRALSDLWRSLHETDEPIQRHEDALLAARLQLVSTLGWPAEPASASAAPHALRLDPTVGSDIAALLAHADAVDLEPVAAAITDPTLVAAGTRDEFADPAQSHLLFGAIENALLLEIDSGHAILLERPAELLDAVASFIAQPTRHPPGARIEGKRP